MTVLPSWLPRQSARNTLGDGVVRLSPFELTDAPTIHAWDVDPETQRWFDWPLTPDAADPTTTPGRLASAADTVRSAWRQWEAGQQFAFLIHSHGTGVGLGWIDLQPRGTGRGNVAYALLPAGRRQGAATRAVRLASRYAFDVLGWFRLEIRVNVDNVASRSVAIRAGYQLDGVLRAHGLIEKHEPLVGRRFDEAIYSRLRTDPEPSSDGHWSR